MKIRLLFTIMIFLITPAWAERDSVDLLDSSNKTIKSFSGTTPVQACANEVVAGQTCLVNEGTYSGRIIIAESGDSSRGYISFTGNPSGAKPIVRGFFADHKSYIKISNFEITHVDGSVPEGIYFYGGNHSQILNNTIHHTMGSGIRVGHQGNAGNVATRNPGSASSRCDYMVIKDNTISFSGVVPGYNGMGEGAMLVAGDHNLIEGNDISHVGDFTNVFGQFNVIRNNYFHDVSDSDFPSHGTGQLGHHLDGLQYFSSYETDHQVTDPATGFTYWATKPSISMYTLFEGNKIMNAPMPHAHAMILRDTAGHGSREFLMRKNLVVNIGGDGGSANPYDHVRIVHNTYVDIAKEAWYPIYLGNSQSNVYTGVDSSGGKVFNNIFYNSGRDGAGIYSVDAYGANGFKADNNLAFRTQGSTSWRGPGSVNYGANDIALQNVNPLFIDANYSDGSYDFSVRINSEDPTKDAVDAGGFLTKTLSAGTNSRTMVVDDAGFFFDGYGIEGLQADEIQIEGQRSSVQIESINYQTNTITLKIPLTWEANKGVSYKYLGNAPDIGALETESLNCAASNIRCVGVNQEYSTIQSCANAAVAGDVCLVYPGTYDERVRPRNSGTSQTNRIIYRSAFAKTAKVQGFGLQSINYITIEGFEITSKDLTPENDRRINLEGGTGIKVLNNYIHDTSYAQCILSRATFSVFRGNDISYCGMAMSILGTTPGAKTITAGVNDQIKFTVDGNSSQTITLPPGTYNGSSQYSTLRNAVNPTMVGASLEFGASGMFEIRSSNVSPTSRITLEPVTHSAYETFGWSEGLGAMQGLGAAFTIARSDTLVEDNKISHVGDYVTTGEGAERVVIRNNTFGPADFYSAQHIDGVQSNSALTVGTKKLLFEGNASIDNRNADNHLGLFQQNGDSNLVFRFNVVANSNGGIDCTRGSWYGMSNTTTPGLFLYHNTYYNNAPYISYNSPQLYCRTSSNNYSLNNIWYNSTPVGSTYSTNPYSIDGYLGTKDNDLWYLGGNPVETNAINKDPLLLNSANGNFNLTVSSPALDTAAALTKTLNTATNSTTVVVANAGFFQDGWGGGAATGVLADEISIGSTDNHAQIVSIDYVTNTITLATPLSWGSNDPVWLYSNSSSERVIHGLASDIGAFEYQVGSVYGSQIGFGDVSGDGNVNIYDASLVAQYAIGLNPQNFNVNVADVSGEGTINIYDASLIAQYAVGLISKFPRE